jgi:beta-lactam-binding protein with PASTA domain
MTEPRGDTWPKADEPTLVEHETLVAAPPPPDRRIGWGMVVAIVVVALVVLGALLAWLLTHRSNDDSTVTTVVTTQSATAVQVTMPDVQGQTLRTARASLESAGLKTTVTKVTSSKPAGTVVDQAPDAGAKLAKGASVTVSVSQPPQPAATAPATTAAAPAPAQPTTATVPDLSGQSEQQAVQALDEAGILASLVFVPSDQPLGAVTSGAQAGKIVQQSPLGGGKAPRNGQVLVYLGALKAQ